MVEGNALSIRLVTYVPHTNSVCLLLSHLLMPWCVFCDTASDIKVCKHLPSTAGVEATLSPISLLPVWLAASRHVVAQTNPSQQQQQRWWSGRGVKLGSKGDHTQTGGRPAGSTHP